MQTPVPEARQPVNLSKEPVVKFFADGELYEPAAYIDLLQQLSASTGITRDRYGTGARLKNWKKKFAAITGKESDLFCPVVPWPTSLQSLC